MLSRLAFPSSDSLDLKFSGMFSSASYISVVILKINWKKALLFQSPLLQSSWSNRANTSHKSIIFRMATSLPEHVHFYQLAKLVHYDFFIAHWGPHREMTYTEGLVQRANAMRFNQDCR